MDDIDARLGLGTHSLRRRCAVQLRDAMAMAASGEPAALADLAMVALDEVADVADW